MNANDDRFGTQKTLDVAIQEDLCSVDKYQTISDRLERKYGLGDNPSLRRELYDRLQREAIKHGYDVYKLIEGCVRSADSARDPGKYFAAAVTRRCRELGFLEEPGCLF